MYVIFPWYNRDVYRTENEINNCTINGNLLCIILTMPPTKLCLLLFLSNEAILTWYAEFYFGLLRAFLSADTWPILRRNQSVMDKSFLQTWTRSWMPLRPRTRECGSTSISGSSAWSSMASQSNSRWSYPTKKLDFSYIPNQTRQFSIRPTFSCRKR